jgi:hypothetical protein
VDRALTTGADGANRTKRVMRAHIAKSHHASTADIDDGREGVSNAGTGDGITTSSYERMAGTDQGAA